MIALISSPFAQSLITVVHCCTCVLLILVVLIQSGKGAEISASFSGSSQTVFGSSGGANFFTHFTRGAAGLFMVTSILLTVGSSQSKESIFEKKNSNAPAQTAPATPAQDASKPAAPATSSANAPATGNAPAPAPKK